MSLSPLSVRLTLGNCVAAAGAILVVGVPSLLATLCGLFFALGTLVGPLVLIRVLLPTAAISRAGSGRAMIALDPLRRMFYGDGAEAADPSSMPDDVMTAGGRPSPMMLPPPRSGWITV